MKNTNLIIVVIVTLTFGINLNAIDRADVLKLNGETALQVGKYQINA